MSRQKLYIKQYGRATYEPFSDYYYDAERGYLIIDDTSNECGQIFCALNTAKSFNEFGWFNERSDQPNKLTYEDIQGIIIIPTKDDGTTLDTNDLLKSDSHNIVSHTRVSVSYYKITDVYFTKEYLDKLEKIIFIPALKEGATYNATTNTLYLNRWDSVCSLAYMYGDAIYSKVWYLDYFGDKTSFRRHTSNNVIIIKKELYASEIKSIASVFRNSHIIILDSNEEFDTDEKSNIIPSDRAIIFDIDNDGKIIENENKRVLIKNKIMDLGDIINEINITENRL